MNNEQFHLSSGSAQRFGTSFTSPLYQMMLFGGEGSFSLDMTPYEFSGNTVLFFSPWQHFQWMADAGKEIDCLSFHADFYCIEYHKKEVACNGLLFNNIYQQPHFQVSDATYVELVDIFRKLKGEIENDSPYSDSILKSYLQLVLAICSREKNQIVNLSEVILPFNSEIATIQKLVEDNFLQERSPAFYAETLALSSSSFTKKTKRYFGKSPLQLIQDKVILEAKKKLHLTHKSVKEIASELNFDDEFYFSRYFKKNVGLSPIRFREQVGISIVAK